MKASAIIRICIWTLVLLALCAVLVVGLAFHSFDIGSWFRIGGSYTYGDVSSYSVGNTELDPEDIRAIKIDWVAGSIHIAAYDGDTVLVTETATANRDHAMRWRVRDGELQIRYRKPYRVLGFGFGKNSLDSKELTIYLPASEMGNLAPLERLSIDNVSAEIQLCELNVYELDIDSVSARIVMQNMVVSDLELENVSGTVNASSCTIDDLEAHTVSGNMTIEGVIDRVDLQTVSATLGLISSRCPRFVSAQSVSGDVRLSIPAATSGFRLDLDSLSGSVYAGSFEMQAHGGGSYVYGDGSAQFNVESVSGSVEIRKIYTEE